MPHLPEASIDSRNDPDVRVAGLGAALPHIVQTSLPWQAWFGLSAGLYYVITLATQGRWLLSRSMWAEMASNYYPNAHSSSWAARLLSTDSGYLPIPQRLIALAEAFLHLPASTAPYFYGASSIVLGGLLVASFCHRMFRPLIEDDRVRFVLCAMFCLIPDFETRGFINFTYLGLLMVAPMVAVSLVRKAADAPAWAWVLPLFMLSKPVFLALMPAMLLAACVAKPRFRAVMIASLLAGAAQLVRLSLSSKTGDNSENFVNPDATLIGRLATSVASGAGMLANFILGPGVSYPLAQMTPWLLVLAGAALTAGLLAMLLRHRAHPSAALLLVSLSLVYAVGLLNSFALSAMWTLSLNSIVNFLTSRSSFGAIAGGIFALFAAVELLVGRTGPYRARWRMLSPFTVAVAWLLLSGWPIVAWRAQPRSFPMTGSSYWTELADKIERRTSPLCVPADPYQSYRRLFMYRDGCVQLNIGPPADARALMMDESAVTPVPEALRLQPISGLIVLVRPAVPAPVMIRVRAIAVTAGGGEAVYEGSRAVGAEGGLVLLLPEGDAKPVELAGVRLVTAPAVPVMQAGDRPGIIYLGVER